MTLNQTIDMCVATLTVAGSVHAAAILYKTGIPFMPALFGCFMGYGMMVCVIAAVMPEGGKIR